MNLWERGLILYVSLKQYRGIIQRIMLEYLFHEEIAVHSITLSPLWMPF